MPVQQGWWSLYSKKRGVVGCVRANYQEITLVTPFVLQQRKEGRNKSDGQIGVAATIMQSLCCFFIVKKELFQKVKLSVYHGPTLTYGHEHCIITKKARCRKPK